MAVRVRVRVDGVRELLRAYEELPDHAKHEAAVAATALAAELARYAIFNAQARGRQGALAATAVKAEPGIKPTVSAGRKGTKRARAVVQGTEFGATRHFGWYAKGRYFDSEKKQFPPHLGANSYWFFKAQEDHGPRIGQRYAEALDQICRQWGGS